MDAEKQYKKPPSFLIMSLPLDQGKVLESEDESTDLAESDSSKEIRTFRADEQSSLLPMS